MMDAALDFLNGDFLDGPGGAAGRCRAGFGWRWRRCDLGGVLESLGALAAKLAAARSAVLARFDAVRGHDARRLRLLRVLAGGQGPYHAEGGRCRGAADAAVPRAPGGRRGGRER